MTVSIATTPQYLAAGNPSQIAFTLSAGGNFVRGYFVDAPLGSEIKDQLLKTGATRLPAFEADASKTWLATFETGGVYTLQLEEYIKGSALYGGGYQDSPDGFATETLIVDNFVTISVGQKVTQKIGFGGDTATLTLFVVDNNVRATTFSQHGFVSPLIDAAATQKAKTASLNASIVAAVSGLVDQSVTTLLGDIQASFNSLIIKFQNHAQSGTYHPSADTDNNPGSADLIYPSLSPEGLKRSVTAFIGYLSRHMSNDDGAGTGSASYHVGGRSDWANALLAHGVGSNILDSFVAYADLWRAYEGHRADAVVHTVADTSHVAVALPPLLNLHRLFLAELAKQNPTAPASVNPGVTALVHGAGFEES